MLALVGRTDGGERRSNVSASAQLKNRADAEVPDPRLLSAAVEACADGLAIVAKDRVIYANPAFARCFGYAERAQVQGRLLSEFVSNEQMAEGRTASATPASIQAACISFHEGGTNLVVVTVRDVTLQRRMEQALGEAQKMETLGRLVSGVAHDFNNLLTAVTLYGDLLVAGLAQDRRLRHHAEEIRMAGQQGAALIRQLLALARPEAAQYHTLSFNQVIASMQGMLTRLIGENIQLTASLADDLGLVRMDPGQVQQIILNLALNARDAMPEGGQLRFETHNRNPMPPIPGREAGRSAGYVELAVADTGCGMDEETRAHLFEPFFTTKRPGRGNGLGLATAASIIKQDGGTIQVVSEVGRGTRVTVTLPRAQENLSSDPNLWPSDPDLVPSGPNQE